MRKNQLSGLAGPDYDATISFGLPLEPEDSQYGKYRLRGVHLAFDRPIDGVETAVAPGATAMSAYSGGTTMILDGAINSTYTVQASDNGKVIKVRVTVTDDAGNEESLTSDGTSAVVR